MTNYPKLQESINRLNELLALIKDKDREVVVAKDWNDYNNFDQIAIDVSKIRRELKALKTEYNQLLTKIKIR